MEGDPDRNITAGLRAASIFMRMLNEAVAGCSMPMKWRFSEQGLGVLLNGRYWLGVEFEDPDQLCFQVNAPLAPAKPLWRRTARLGSDEVRFYFRSAVDQMHWLETFLRESLVMARRLSVPERTG